MNTRSARPLVESALLAALGAVMMLIAWYVPFIGVVVGLVSPLPAAVAVIRHGVRWGVLSSAVTMLVLAPFVGWVTALGLWVVNGAMGVSFGFAVRRGYRSTLVLITAALGSFVAVVAEFLSAYFVLGLTLGKQIDEMISLWSEAIEINKKILGPNPVIDDFAKMLPSKDMMISMLPAVVFLAAFILAFVNFELFRRILPRLGYNLEGLPPFSRWIFPEPVAILGMVSILTPMVVAQFGLSAPGVVQAMNNITVVTSLLFVGEALAVATFYLLRAGLPRLMVGFFIFAALSMTMGSGPLSLMVALFGMIDILFDFRHVRFEPVGEI